MLSFLRPRPIEQESEIGTFPCPRCGKETAFTRVQLSLSFTFYSEPVMRVKQLAEFVRCQECRADFKTDEMGLTPAQLAFLTLPWKCPECGKDNEARSGKCVACLTSKPLKPVRSLNADRGVSPHPVAVPHAHQPRKGAKRGAFDY
jgi:predicted RNA-binding Zn-ribbon protein involved in translation (DUF1610 family)